MMLVTYDSSVDALYIHLHPDAQVDRSIMVNEARVVDVDPSGRAVGIEIISPSAGFDLSDIIERFNLHELKDELAQVPREFREATTA